MVHCGAETVHCVKSCGCGPGLRLPTGPLPVGMATDKCTSFACTLHWHVCMQIKQRGSDALSSLQKSPFSKTMYMFAYESCDSLFSGPYLSLQASGWCLTKFLQHFATILHIFQTALPLSRSDICLETWQFRRNRGRSSQRETVRQEEEESKTLSTVRFTLWKRAMLYVNIATAA